MIPYMGRGCHHQGHALLLIPKRISLSSSLPSTLSSVASPLVLERGTLDKSKCKPDSVTPLQGLEAIFFIRHPFSLFYMSPNKHILLSFGADTPSIFTLSIHVLFASVCNKAKAELCSEMMMFSCFFFTQTWLHKASTCDVAGETRVCSLI